MAPAVGRSTAVCFTGWSSSDRGVGAPAGDVYVRTFRGVVMAARGVVAVEPLMGVITPRLASEAAFAVQVPVVQAACFFFL
mmetsp:Transcript_26265/g.67920  ORF Transcript_26265/g.67920 Transcript_26265/m.67920 type:complete len:81 (-) Transcript_26265:1663-1905(-)